MAGGLVSAGLLEREPNANADVVVVVVVGAVVVLVEPNAENVVVDCGFGVSLPNEKPLVALAGAGLLPLPNAPPNLNVDVVSLGLFVSTGPNWNVGLVVSFDDDDVAPNLNVPVFVSGLFSLEDEPNAKVAAAGLSQVVV